MSTLYWSWLIRDLSLMVCLGPLYTWTKSHDQEYLRVLENIKNHLVPCRMPNRVFIHFSLCGSLGPQSLV